MLLTLEFTLYCNSKHFGPSITGNSTFSSISAFAAVRTFAEWQVWETVTERSKSSIAATNSSVSTTEW
jgi:hypothetical protein